MAVGLAAGVLAGCGSDTASDKKVITLVRKLRIRRLSLPKITPIKVFDVDLSNALAKEMGYESNL